MKVLPLVKGDEFNNHFAPTVVNRTADFTAIYVPKPDHSGTSSAIVCGVTYWIAGYQPRRWLFCESSIRDLTSSRFRREAICMLSCLSAASRKCSLHPHAPVCLRFRRILFAAGILSAILAAIRGGSSGIRRVQNALRNLARRVRTLSTELRHAISKVHVWLCATC
jgi:hypothetical protein